MATAGVGPFLLDFNDELNAAAADDVCLTLILFVLPLERQNKKKK